MATPAIDFARSFLTFRSSRVNHTPRLQLDAACSLSGPGVGGEPRAFYLTCPCIGERMYLPSGLIHEPPFEFLMIGEHGREYAILRRHASAARDSREAHLLGEAMSTQSGVPAPVTALDIRVPTSERAQPATTHADLRAALDEGRPVVGRTTYLCADGETTAVLEYPVKTLNVAVDRPLWQVDTGPVLVPDFEPGAPGAPAPGGPMAGRFALAYLVFNSWERIELALRRPTALGPDPATGAAPGAATEHYSELRTLAARNELFSLAA